MKTKTRITAMLLTLLMVVGLLPLSLFALDEKENVTEAVASKKSYQSVISALASKNFVSHLYLDFESQAVGALAQSANNFDKEDTVLTENSDGTISGGSVSATRITSPNGGRVDYKNHRTSYEIKEENGNKSFYLGYAPLTKYTDHNDNYLDAVLNTENTRGHDLYFSVDLKMGGSVLSETYNKESLFTFINRDNGRLMTSTIWVSNVGGLYTENNFSPESLIGYLSDAEYTSISIHVKLSENKFYVYINDILVTPEGKTFLTLNSNGNYGKTDKTPDQYMLNQIRIYDTLANISAEAHAGLYIDNVIIAARAPREEHNTVKTPLYVTDFSEVKLGAGPVAGTAIPGTSGMAGVTLTPNRKLPDSGILTWVSDGDDTVLKIGKPLSAGTEGETFIVLQGTKSIVGKNYSTSIEFKMASETLGNQYRIIAPKNRGGESAVNITTIDLRTDGRIYCGSNLLGTASTDKYTNVTVDIACNEAAVTVYVYVDGVLKYTYSPSKMPWSSPSEYYIDDIAFMAGYEGVLTNMLESELYVKSIDVSLTDRYNSGQYISCPLEVKPSGLVENAGILRYYNEDGTFKTENFTLDGEKYIVGFNGSVLGRETDGVEMSYAEYFESTFTYGTDKNIKITDSIDGGLLNSSYLGKVRAAYNVGVKIGGKSARYYVSYVNDKVTSQDSYRDFSTSYTNDSTIVFDFDIMLDGYTGAEKSEMYSLITVLGRAGSSNVYTRKVLTISENGWLKSGSRMLLPLSQNEFTKISVVITTPESGKKGGTFDIYANGVLMLEDQPIDARTTEVRGIRAFDAYMQSLGMYVKNISMYVMADKPMQFRTMVNGEAVVTDDQTKTPVKASDLKKGLIFENGVYRYYDSIGLPIVNGSVTVDGTEFSTNDAGKIVCSELSHIGEEERGICSYCGNKLDGASAIYGNSLVLGNDVKVMFYLDIDPVKRLGLSVEIGREVDYEKKTTFVTPITDLATVKIDGKTYYQIGYSVPAKDLSEKIKVRIVRADGTTGTEYTYSALDYINAVKEQEVSSKYPAELKTLVGALEAYGVNAYAALLGGQHVSVGDVDWNAVSEATGSKADGSTVRLEAITLDLKAKIRLRIYFNIKSGSLSDYTVTVNGSRVNAVEAGNDIYCIDYPIYASKLNSTVEFVIARSDGQTMLTLNMSPLYYAKQMAVKYDGENAEAYKCLMSSIYKYWEAAEDYSKCIASSSVSQGKLYGKTVYGFGDSLVQGYKNGIGFLDSIVNKYGMAYTNYAVDGAKINLGAESSIYAQIQGASSACPDFVVFDGLIGDVDSYQRGEIANGFDEEFDTTTFCGSFETIIKLIKEKYPTAAIVYVTPHKMPAGNPESFKDFVDAAIKICEKWGVAVADVYYEGDIDTRDEEQRLTYSYAQTEGDGAGDGTNLISAGYDIFYSPIVSKTMSAAGKMQAAYNALNGKTIYSFGDSLVDGTVTEGYGMLTKVVSDTGLVYTKYAVRGSTINLHNGNQEKVVYNQIVAASDVCPDFIVFNGLTNDCSKSWALGEISEGFNAELDTTTFCGSFETILRTFKEKYPTAKIIYVTPHKMTARDAESLKLYVETALAICEKWGVAVADVYHKSGLDLNDAEMGPAYSRDGCHLYGIGYETFYAPIILDTILDLIR